MLCTASKCAQRAPKLNRCLFVLRATRLGTAPINAKKTMLLFTEGSVTNVRNEESEVECLCSVFSLQFFVLILRSLIDVNTKLFLCNSISCHFINYLPKLKHSLDHEETSLKSIVIV